MAKLNVVIPAVEVTVDGVAYRKVDRKAQAGDIVKALESDLDIDKGAFYGPVTGADTDCVEFTDNVGDQRRRGSVSYEVYAPISEPAAETKPDTITFKGAEWRKVNRNVREGDAIKFTDEDRSSYLTESELYVVDRVDGADDPQITDDDGDSYDAYVDNYEVYEKVVETSAQEYHEVKRKADVGERIKIVAATENGGYYENGDILTVSRADRWQGAGSGMSISAEGIGIAIYHSEYVVLEPVDAEPTKPERLAVGDYARVTTIDDIDGTTPVSYVNVGDIFEISEDDKTSVPYYGKRVTDGKTACFMAERLVRATDEEVAAAKDSRKQFAIGDYVKVAVEYCEHNVGDVLKITKMGGVHDFAVTNVATDRYGFIYANKIVKLTAEEVAEIERKREEEDARRREESKWSAIGRKVNEFKVGDIVECSGSLSGHAVGTIGTIVYDAASFAKLRVKANGEVKSHTGSMKLLVPVEQRFDTKEVDAT